MSKKTIDVMQGKIIPTLSVLKKVATHPYTAAFFRVALGVIFVFASWDKILHPEAFARSVANYKILPLESVNLFAIILPWLELVCGVLLCLGLFTGGSMLIVTFLIALFLVALSSALLRGIDISCGCFSSQGTDSISFFYLARDLILFTFAFQMLRYDQKALSLRTLIIRRNSR